MQKQTFKYVRFGVICYLYNRHHHDKTTGAIGDNIRIKATDDFEVVAVDVSITDKNGKELERGLAVRYKRKPSMWVYTVTVDNSDLAGTVVNVTAKDRPGNTVIKTETVASNLKPTS